MSKNLTKTQEVTIRALLEYLETDKDENQSDIITLILLWIHNNGYVDKLELSKVLHEKTLEVKFHHDKMEDYMEGTAKYLLNAIVVSISKHLKKFKDKGFIVFRVIDSLFETNLVEYIKFAEENEDAPVSKFIEHMRKNPKFVNTINFFIQIPQMEAITLKLTI